MRLVLLVLFVVAFAGVRAHWNISAAAFPPWGSYFFGLSPQGVADDPLNGQIIFNGKDAVSVVTVSNSQSRYSGILAYKLEIVSQQLFGVIPFPLRKRSYDHMGDVDFVPQTQQLLAPIEEPSFTRPVIAVYNRSSTAWFNYYFRARARGLKRCPWVAFVESDSREAPSFVVSSEFDNVTKIHKYSWPQLKSRGTIQLEKVGRRGIMHVQGGVVRGGVLFLSTSQGANAHDHNFFSYDLSAVISGKSKTAPLVASFHHPFPDEADVQGISIDSLSRMWVVTIHRKNVLGFPIVYSMRKP